MNIFSEVGIGNSNLISTEYELPDGSENRVPGFKVKNIQELYIRVWVGYSVFILSTKEGFKITKKSRKRFKLILGFANYGGAR